jgi:endonuclease/exonuclease/phosphatase family metal-dependent hydrolase
MIRARTLPGIALVLAALPLASQVAIVSIDSHVRERPEGTAPSCFLALKGDTLVPQNDSNYSGWYRVLARNGCTGYVYRNRVRLRALPPPAWAAMLPPGTDDGDTFFLHACSFNIKFIGFYHDKDHAALADLLRGYDLVAVQELTAPPAGVRWPDGGLAAHTDRSEAFFALMRGHGFAHALSTEDTGPNTNRNTGFVSEWFVVFYKPELLRYVPQRSGFIDMPLTRNATHDRVPFAFHFATTDGTLDFTLIDVHTTPARSGARRRADQMEHIGRWVASDTSGERDHLIVGDMNFEDCDELNAAMPPGFTSLNADCQRTNVRLARDAKPYDHVLYRPDHTARDLDLDFGFRVVDLVEAVRPYWPGAPSTYPPASSQFAKLYSDHNPVEFRLVFGIGDDD